MTPSLAKCHASSVGGLLILPSHSGLVSLPDGVLFWVILKLPAGRHSCGRGNSRGKRGDLFKKQNDISYRRNVRDKKGDRDCNEEKEKEREKPKERQ